MKLSVTVNGQYVEKDIPANLRLIDFIRDVDGPQRH